MSFTPESIMDSVLRCNNAGCHMKELSSIVIDDTLSANEKMTKLKISILKYKGTPVKKVNIDEKVKKEYSELFNNIPESNNLKKMELIIMMNEPANKHSKLLSNIGAVIRDKDYCNNNEQKINIIMELLI